MKKISLFIILILSLFCLSSCGKKMEIDISNMEETFTKQGFTKKTGVNALFEKDAYYIFFEKGYGDKIDDVEEVTFQTYKNRVYEINIHTSYPSRGTFWKPDRNYYPEYQAVKDRLDEVFSIIKLGIDDEELIKLLEVAIEELKSNPDPNEISVDKTYENSKYFIKTSNFVHSKFIYIDLKEDPENF